MIKKKRILYIGGFQLPDKNAAAHRVLGIGKSMRDAGYIVEYMDVSDSYLQDTLSDLWECQGFTVYSQRHSANIKQRIRYSIYPLHVEEILDSKDDWFAVVAYNYPALALHKLKKICHNRKILTISDCTEWYGFDVKTIRGFLNYVDSEIRMRIIQKKIDGTIAISQYLGDYYKKYLPTIVVPPTVDIGEAKWHQIAERKMSDKLILTYAGSFSVSKSKDRLDEMISAIAGSAINVVLNIIGFSREQYLSVYEEKDNNIDKLIESGKLVFWGRLKHEVALKVLQQSDYCLFFRKRSRLAQAGFPTKFVESISCGVPVLTTDTSDLKKYIKGNGFFVSPDEIENSLTYYQQQAEKLSVDKSLFDYRNYSQRIGEFLHSMVKDNE